MDNFHAGFADELVKVGVIFGGGSRDDAVYKGGNKMLGSYARGAMRRLGLNPDSPTDRKVAMGTAGVGGVALLTLPGAIAGGGSKRYTRKMIAKERQAAAAAREARKAQSPLRRAARAVRKAVSRGRA